MTDSRSIEQLACRLRTSVREKAGLPPDWLKASERMRAFYRDLARRYLEAGKFPA